MDWCWHCLCVASAKKGNCLLWRRMRFSRWHLKAVRIFLMKRHLDMSRGELLFEAMVVLSPWWTRISETGFEMRAGSSCISWFCATAVLDVSVTLEVDGSMAFSVAWRVAQPESHSWTAAYLRAEGESFFRPTPDSSFSPVYALRHGLVNLRLTRGPAGNRTTTGSLSASSRMTPYQLSHEDT